MKKRLFTVSLLVILLLTALTACGEELPAVYVQSVNDIMGYGVSGEFNICAGVVVAQNEVEIQLVENRKVAKLNVQAGDMVSVGDVLFVYDMEEIRLTIAKAELEIEQLENKITDCQEQIEELEDEKKWAPESEQLSYTVHIQSLEMDKMEAEYTIKEKEQELKDLKASADDGQVKATISGKVKSVNENGAADEFSGQALPYITLIEEGAVRIKGTVNELNRKDFFEGQAVVVRSRVDEEMTWTGVIAAIETSPEEFNNNDMYYYGMSQDEMTSSGSYPFYVQLDSTEGLLLGQHVYVEPAESDESQAGLWLNASYVAGSEVEGFYVWADKGGELEKRPVEVGTLDEMLYAYEILSGLEGTDRIAFPEEGLQEGAPVTEVQNFLTPEQPEETYGQIAGG